MAAAFNPRRVRQSRAKRHTAELETALAMVAGARIDEMKAHDALKLARAKGHKSDEYLTALEAWKRAIARHNKARGTVQDVKRRMAMATAQERS